MRSGKKQGATVAERGWGPVMMVIEEMRELPWTRGYLMFPLPRLKYRTVTRARRQGWCRKVRRAQRFKQLLVSRCGGLSVGREKA